MGYRLMIQLSDKTVPLFQFHFTGLGKDLGPLVNNLLDSFDCLEIDRILEINQTLFLVQIRLLDKFIDLADHVMLQLASLPRDLIPDLLLLQLKTVDHLANGERLLDDLQVNSMLQLIYNGRSSFALVLACVQNTLFIMCSLFSGEPQIIIVNVVTIVWDLHFIPPELVEQHYLFPLHILNEIFLIVLSDYLLSVHLLHKIDTFIQSTIANQLPLPFKTLLNNPIDRIDELTIENFPHFR
jgi:hypothetical protein